MKVCALELKIGTYWGLTGQPAELRPCIKARWYMVIEDMMSSSYLYMCAHGVCTLIFTYTTHTETYTDTQTHMYTHTHTHT